MTLERQMADDLTTVLGTFCRVQETHIQMNRVSQKWFIISRVNTVNNSE